MIDALQAKIESDIAEVTWDALAAHASRDALYFVDPSVGLVAAALAIAENRARIVTYWIESRLLSRPSTDDVAEFGRDPASAHFRVAIVQPYVLAERLSG